MPSMVSYPLKNNVMLLISPYRHSFPTYPTKIPWFNGHLNSLPSVDGELSQHLHGRCFFVSPLSPVLRCFGLTPARHSSSKPAEEYDVTDSAGGAETGGAAETGRAGWKRGSSGIFRDVMGIYKRNTRGLLYWLVVTGTMEFYDFPFSWEFHDPNWRTHIFQRGRYSTNQTNNMIYG
jgi:hypothetical protein